MERLMAHLMVLKWNMWAYKNMLTKAPWHAGYIPAGERKAVTDGIILHHDILEEE